MCTVAPHFFATPNDMGYAPAMNIPPEQAGRCPKCGTSVVEALTNRTSQGRPVTVLLSPTEDAENHSLPSEQYILSQTAGQRLFAGQPTRTQRLAMLARGQRFNAEHTKSECAKLAKHRGK